MTAPLTISGRTRADRRVFATAVSASSRRARGQHPQAPLHRVHAVTADPIEVPLAAAQPGGHAVSAAAIAVQEWACDAQEGVTSPRQAAAAYPSLTTAHEILPPGMTSVVPLINVSVNVRA